MSKIVTADDLARLNAQLANELQSLPDCRTETCPRTQCRRRNDTGQTVHWVPAPLTLSPLISQVAGPRFG
jgi:hypothetical protein